MVILRQTTHKTIKSTTTLAAAAAAAVARGNGGGHHHYLSSLNRRLTSRSFGIIAANSSTANIKLLIATTRRSTASASLIYAQQQQQQQQVTYSTLQQQQRSQPLIPSYGTSTKNINCYGVGSGCGDISRMMVNNNCNNIAWMQRCFYSGQHHHQQHHQQQQQQQQQQSTYNSYYYYPAAMMMMTAAAAIVGGATSTSTHLTSTATTAMSSGSSEPDCNRQSSTAAGISTTEAVAARASEGQQLWNVTNDDNLHHGNFFLTGTNSTAGGAVAGVMTGIINSSSSSSRYCHCEEGTTSNYARFVASTTVKSRHQESGYEGDDCDEVITATSPTTTNNTTTTNNEEEEEDNLPTYTMSTVSQYNGQPTPSNPNKRIWMTYGGYVYDVTEFIVNHPGGSEKIMMGAGGAIEPYWYLYRQHFASSLPMNLLSKMVIGKLHPSDQEHIDEQMENVAEQTPDPYENEPERNTSLIVHGDTPMNAEVPEEMITMSYLTPNDMFYIRHHHPVPYLSEGALEEFRLEVDLTLLFPDAMKRKKKAEGGGSDSNSSGSGGGSNDDDLATTTTAVDIVRRETADTSASKSCSNSVVAKLSLEQIKSLPKVELTSTLQCSGNRRGGFNTLRQTSGTPWGQGAISTAKWGGARLIDVLMLAMDEASKEVVGPSGKKKRKWKNKYGGGGGDDGGSEQSLIETLHNLQRLIDDHPELQHLRFESLDGMLASIDANKGLNPFGDVIIAYEMNGEDLPRDHGYPLRVIVPGYAAVRNVKWLKKLELAEEEAFGTWQRGLNYKILPPTVLDAKEVDLDIMPGLSEECVFSGITRVENLSHTPVVARDGAATTATATTLEDEIFGSMSVGRGLGGGPRTPLTPGETVLVKASGWAYAGGGRNIVRVDVTGNNGKSWQTATITEGYNQPIRRAWAWVFWECEVPAIVCEDGVSVELACKGVDMAFNTQPESLGGMWNVRGLVNNSYYRVKHKVM